MKTLGMTLIMVLVMVVFACAAPTLQVTPVGVTWTTPTTNTDLTPLTDLAGYKVYWTVGPGEFVDVQSMDVKNVNSVEMSVLGLSTGVEYCISVTAYNSILYESGYSNTVCKTNAPLLKIPINPVQKQ
jgi:hypothetical protein